MKTHGLVLGRPVREDWPVLPMLNLACARAADLPISVGILANSDFLSGNVLAYYAALHQLPVRPVVIGMSDDGRSIDEADFVITKTGDPVPSSTRRPMRRVPGISGPW